MDESTREDIDRRIARQSACIYLPISLGAAAIFLVISTLVGGYPPVARVCGAVWVGLLGLIVSMPIVTSRVKRNIRRTGSE